MLRKASNRLIEWFDTAVASRSDLGVMPTAQSRVLQTQFCSLCLLPCGVVVVDPPLLSPRKPGATASRAEIRGQSRQPHPCLLNPVDSKWMGGLLHRPNCHLLSVTVPRDACVGNQVGRLTPSLF